MHVGVQFHFSAFCFSNPNFENEIFYESFIQIINRFQMKKETIGSSARGPDGANDSCTVRAARASIGAWAIAISRKSELAGSDWEPLPASARSHVHGPSHPFPRPLSGRHDSILFAAARDFPSKLYADTWPSPCATASSW